MKPQDLLNRLAAGYEYDPMYGALCNERDQLKDENAKLVVKLNAERIARQNVEIENAKLRELVAEMFNACPMCVNCAHNHLTVGWYDRMKELGVTP